MSSNKWDTKSYNRIIFQYLLLYSFQQHSKEYIRVWLQHSDEQSSWRVQTIDRSRYALLTLQKIISRHFIAIKTLDEILLSDKSDCKIISSFKIVWVRNVTKHYWRLANAAKAKKILFGQIYGMSQIRFSEHVKIFKIQTLAYLAF